MTTYRKDAKEQRALIHHDSLKVQNELWARTNCLLGAIVLSILIASVALAISILLLLQSFEVAGLENARVADLEMRIKYLERLTENMQPKEENDIEQPVDAMGAPPPPPPPPQSTPPPVATPPRTEILRNDGGAKPGVLLPTENEENEAPGMADKGRTRPPYIHPSDDEDSPDPWFEGSGDDCPPDPPRPVCPGAMRLCQTKQRCPAYVCCN